MNKRVMLITSLALIILIIGGIIIFKMANNSKPTRVMFETTKGNIVIELYSEQKITSSNFENLVKKGTYNGVIFHRVIEGFMIQGGDPTGTGYGDRTIPVIKDEFNGVQKNNRGTISMANAGPNTGSSQFFINLVDNNFLDGRHPVFGIVVEGMDVVDSIAQVRTDPNDRPLEEVKIIKAKIL